MQDLCLICVEMFCYVSHSRQYILFMCCDSTAIPSKLSRYVNLRPLINDTPSCYQIIISMERRFVNCRFKLRAQELIQGGR